MDNSNSININYDKILEIALTGVRRAAAFMGFGVNAAADHDFNKYQLTDISHIQLLPMDLPKESVDEMKKHFLTWIVGCGLRELIESFSVFLDHIYLASTQVAIIKDGLDIKLAERDYRKFQHDGVEKKLANLNDYYKIESKHPSYIASINQARNCLTHRRGIVEARDCNNGVLKISWLGMDMIVNTPSGEKLLLDKPLKKPIILEEGGTISVRFIEREIFFSIGQLIEIEPNALAEISSYITSEAKNVVSSSISFCKAKGLHVQHADVKGNKI